MWDTDGSAAGAGGEGSGGEGGGVSRSTGSMPELSNMDLVPGRFKVRQNPEILREH